MGRRRSRDVNGIEMLVWNEVLWVGVGWGYVMGYGVGFGFVLVGGDEGKEG